MPILVTDVTHITIDDSLTPGRAEARRRWARLIQRVFEADPLICTRCGGRMKVIAFIESHQHEVIEGILDHLGLGRSAGPRAPPPTPDRGGHATPRELQYVPVFDHVAAGELVPGEGSQVDRTRPTGDPEGAESWTPDYPEF